MRWTVYILRCADDTLYTGITTNIARRLAEHNSGKGARYTKYRTPVELVYQEDAKDRSLASQRERAIKALSREEKLAMLTFS